jgi:hypothetical protein
MAHGARPNHFTWAMLGRVDAVRAVVQASPGVATITGPHGITLLAHARAGGDAAAAVVDYLEGLGTADPRPVAVPLSVDEVAAFVGTYAFGPGAGARLEVTERRGGLQIRPGQGVARVLVHRGRGSFHPAGVPSVRVVFAGSDGPAASLTVIDGDVRLEAPRMP